MHDQDWNPVRHGPTYCSPSCGFSCKHADFVAATNAAAWMCARLAGNWQPRVWENCGWHWEAKLGLMSLSGSMGRWRADFKPDCQYVGQGSTPEAAIRDALAQAKASSAKLATGIVEFTEALNKEKS